MDLMTYSHRCKPEDWDDKKVASVVDIIRDIRIKIRGGCSSRLREAILKELRGRGWSSKVKLSHSSQITITAVNGDLALCIQTGNISRFYADLLKLQYLYLRGSIISAIYVLPTKQNAKLMGSNLAHFERLVEELKLFAEIITVPIFIVGIN
jgi:hypothetical protein